MFFLTIVKVIYIIKSFFFPYDHYSSKDLDVARILFFFRLDHYTLLIPGRISLIIWRVRSYTSPPKWKWQRFKKKVLQTATACLQDFVLKAATYLVTIFHCGSVIYSVCRDFVQTAPSALASPRDSRSQTTKQTSMGCSAETVGARTNNRMKEFIHE